MRPSIVFCLPALSLGLFLLGCAGVELSPRTLELRSRMTEDDALAVLKKYTGPRPDRAHMCLFQMINGTGIDPNEPVELSGTKLSFTARWGVPIGTEYQQSGRDTVVVTKYKPMRSRFTVDVRGARQIRVWKSNAKGTAEVLNTWCPGAQPGHFVLFRAQQELPNAMAPTYHVTTDAGLDELLAALTRLSPSAEIRQGAAL